ncbi:MAG: hypothetical protein ACI8P9_002522 [Parasphingorhabdus sp.]|jgi:hypothetical protein
MPQSELILENFIDLDLYPIHELESKVGKMLIDRCHEMMANESICVLPGFLRETALNQLKAELVDLEPVARQVDFQTTLYGWMDNSGFVPEHPRSRLLTRRCGALTTDQLPQKSVSKQLFQFDELTEFVRQLLGFETLYRSACPHISVRANVMQQGDEFGWHFDTNDGVVSFIIQNADNGGLFEYAPLIRSESDENYAGIEAVLAEQASITTADLSEGCFSLFLGRRSMHRVSFVEQSEHCRHSLLFSYDQQPGMVFSEKITRRLTEPSSEPFLGQNTSTN